LGREDLSGQVPRIDRRAAAVILVECRDGQRHRDNGEHGDGDLQRGRERSMTARPERSAQRYRRARRDCHEHDPDLRSTGQIECPGDDPGQRRHRHQYRE
jgi:hypothetical protein